MASLREVKDHIASVRSTLKITSAMKLVASAKLRKAQQAAEGVRPYTEALAGMLSCVLAAPSATGKGPVRVPQGEPGTGIARPQAPAPASTSTNASVSEEGNQRVGIVAVASNSSLCGAFNINVIHKVQDLVAECRAAGAEVEVISVGRKMAEVMRKSGFAPEDHAALVGRNSFEKSAAFAQELMDAFEAGRYSRILLVYNHFVSTTSQKVRVETYLPFEAGPSEQTEYKEYILEPSQEEILRSLLPQVIRLRVHAVLLDSIAAEHAARTIAMQTASDNAEDLLAELTLEYNKGRQQKITSEILDLVGGSQSFSE